MTKLAHLTWVDMRDRQFDVALLPVGAIEQHGYHLPLGVDSILIDRIATAATESVESKELSGRILLCPTMVYGYSWSHTGFPGTVSLLAANYVDLIGDLLRNVMQWNVSRILVLTGHGGNLVPARMAADIVASESSDSLVCVSSYWQLAAETISAWRKSSLGGICHAGEMETSLMLHLAPSLVRRDRAADEIGRDVEEEAVDLLREPRFYSSRAIINASNSGTLGMPSLGDADRGARLFADIVQDVAAYLHRLAVR